MKGFMFSVDALLSIAVVIAVLALFAQTTTQETNSLSLIQIQQQSDAMMTLYFDQNGLNPDFNSITQSCGTINYYNKLSNSLETKNICRGIK